MDKTKPYVLKKDVIISTIIDDCPKAVELLAEYGIFCVNCYLNQYDTLEQGAMIHNMTDEEVEKMIEEINTELKKNHEA